VNALTLSNPTRVATSSTVGPGSASNVIARNKRLWSTYSRHVIPVTATN
jgi:hypothetical protein